MPSSSILVTGGLGYVGRELVAQLLRTDAGTLHVLDDVSSGEHRLAAMDTQRFTLHRVDVRDRAAVREAVAAVRPSVISFLTRVFGLLLSAIAVQLVIDGVKGLT